MGLSLRTSLFYILALVLASIFIVSIAAHAQTPGSGAGAKIAPAIEEGRIEPGDSFSGSIRITNLESTDRTYRVVVRDIARINNAGAPVFNEPGEKTGYELSDWIVPEVSEITLAPGETRQVSYVVDVPEGASPGGHFGGIFFSADAERQRETGAGVGYQIGTIMNFRIGGDILEKMSIIEFLTRKLIHGTPDVTFGIGIENEGNVLLRPGGFIEISDMFGNEIPGLINVNESRGAVLPNSERTFQVDWEGKGFLFGRYTAIVSLTFGEDGRQTETAATSFWILPLRVIVPVVGSILFILLLIYFSMRFYLRRRLNDMYQTTRAVSRQNMRNARNVRGARVDPRYARSPMPPLAVALIAVLVFTMIFLAILFLLLG